MSERAGQSPPPETQKGSQQGAPPSDGQGVNKNSNNQEESKAQLEVCLVTTTREWLS